MMGFIDRQLNNITTAMSLPCSDEQYCQLYTAQQALSWALDPAGFAEPIKVIESGLVVPLMGTQADSEDCSVYPRQQQS